MNIGDIFGGYEIVGEPEILKLHRRSMWPAKCLGCGKLKKVSTAGLRSNKRGCAACSAAAIGRSQRKTHPVGTRFGRLTVIEGELGSSYGNVTVPVRCDCGEELYVKRRMLEHGQKSCGCLSPEQRAAMGAASRKHGGSGTREFVIWRGMNQRCYNPKRANWKWYGGKGIKVLFLNFEDFLEWAHGHGYAPGLVIDRIDSDNHYSRENCQWITRSENTRRANIKRWRRTKAFRVTGFGG